MNKNKIKIIAAASMMLDHLGVELFPELLILRIIGRLAFPIFAYFIFEGFYYTRDKIKYFMQIFLLGMVCVLGYFIYSQELYWNVLITFSVSILNLFCLEFVKKNFVGKEGWKGLLVFLASLSTTYVLCLYIRVDYGFIGTILPIFPALLHYQNKEYIADVKTKILSEVPLLTFGVGVLLLSIQLGGIQFFGLLSILLLMLSNGKVGSKKLKYFFYWFYPLHLLAIGLISMAL